ncbi:hypothetical protein BaRGS_00007399 [Batillaria attramentaria]|uniref:Fibrinogen C-terminal domain-containing protein n=1 Tax=Batillaria attramentaria TaxID=370345 RepID=A0ABD0LNQ2_9CAEN
MQARDSYTNIGRCHARFTLSLPVGVQSCGVGVLPLLFEFTYVYMENANNVVFQQTNTPSWYCLNGGMVSVDNTACQCVDGYVGDHCERLMEDCDEGIASGHYPGMSGVYWIHPPTSPTPFTVHCNYMVRHFIHMRYDADVDFNVTMAEYVTGFGDMMGDFWLGLEKLHLLTSSRHYTLGVQVSNFSEVYQHYYRRFVVKSAAEGYAMTFDTQYLPQAPALPMSDCLAPLKDIPFSAYDNDNDGNTTRNCAADYGGGWWYNADCSECNLMGTLRWSSLTRVPGAVDEVFWNPGLDPTFSPSNSWMFLFRTP